MSDRPTFGERYRSAGSIESRIELERAEGRRSSFAEVDRVVGDLVRAGMQGRSVAALTFDDPGSNDRQASLVTVLEPEERALLVKHFGVESQERRGTWTLPESEHLYLGICNTSHWSREQPRFPLSHAIRERANVDLRSSPEAVALWSITPLFDGLYLPLKLRSGNWLGARTVEQQHKSWTDIEALYGALDIDMVGADRYRPGTGWSRITTHEVVARREALLASWCAAADGAYDRYRHLQTGTLVEKFYAVKAKPRSRGHVLRRQVITSKVLERTLSSYFGGDWLTFLEYLGEAVHPDEQIVEAHPTTKLMVGSSTKTAAVAEEHGVAVDEIQKMLAAFWQQHDHVSPVERRVSVLRRHWNEFDALHATQSSDSTSSLWGLVEEHAYVAVRPEKETPTRDHDPYLFKRLLSPELNADIDELWGVKMLRDRPERLVTNFAPHATLSEIGGAALRFWNGVSLTAWFLCEGPYSRTDLEGLRQYLHRDIDELAAAGTPINESLFAELLAAQKKYGTPQEGAMGLAIAIGVDGSVSCGSSERKQAPAVTFEQLRDIITPHRRAWMKDHLDTHLRGQWEPELRATAEAYHRHIAEKSKPPTIKQFAALAEKVTNRWFGGNLASVAGVFGVSAPPPPTRGPRLVPNDPDALAMRVFEKLYGPYRMPPSWREDENERARHNALSSLAAASVHYLEIAEATGEPPSLATFGRTKFTYSSAPLSADADEAWKIYQRAVEESLLES
jgi:hypothetical protein